MSTYSYGLGNRLDDSKGVINSPIQSGTVYGRVVRVVLGEDSPDFEQFGRSTAIGGIRYRILGTDRNESVIQDLPFAYMGQVGMKEYPVVGEIVRIYSEPSGDNLSNTPEGTVNYYSTVVNLFNEVNNNRYPDEFQTNLDFYNDPLAPEVTEIFPLRPEPGDVIFQGRLGSTLRLGGYSYSGRNLTSNKPSPYTILKIGKGSIDSITETSVEDINADDASIYLASNHPIPLRQATKTYKTYKTPPADFNTFKGKQIALNSDRVVVNARQDNVLLSSAKAVGLSGNTVNIEGTEYIGIDSKRIFLGEGSIKSETPQPVILGLENEKLLNELLQALEGLANTLTTLTPSPIALTAQLQLAGTLLRTYVTSIKAKLPRLKSKKVFIE